MDDLTDLTIVEISTLIRSQTVSPVDITKAMLSKIESIDPTYQSYQAVTADLARDMAQHAKAEISQGHYKGPLHGVPLAVKDIFDTKEVY